LNTLESTLEIGQNRGVRPSVCIVSHNAYGAMTGGHSGHIGGVERQTSMLARWLVSQGYEVSMLTWDEGGPSEERIDGVRIIKICRKGAGLPMLRFFHPKWTGLIAAMNRADADVYYHNCCEAETGEVALWCKTRGKKFVFSTACDTDCQRDLAVLETPLERMLYRRGIRLAQTIIVQTQTQRQLLREQFGLDSIVIPMPCPCPTEVETRQAPGAGARVLWIARVCEQKRPDRLLDLAEACPELTFDMVGPLYSDAYAKSVADRAKGIRNVVVRGPVQRDGIDALYKSAACFCCTSGFEGFPNTFLEAWGHGLPIVSTFDPDSIIQERELGVVAGDVPKLAAGLRSLLQSPARYQEISRNARQYAFDHHRPEAVMPQFEEVFQQLCEK
jgi:glycosyltransferase involved in cell wall biosynthesis